MPDVLGTHISDTHHILAANGTRQWLFIIIRRIGRLVMRLQSDKDVAPSHSTSAYRFLDGNDYRRAIVFGTAGHAHLWCLVSDWNNRCTDTSLFGKYHDVLRFDVSCLACLPASILLNIIGYIFERIISWASSWSHGTRCSATG
jgi:hypothetical protein